MTNGELYLDGKMEVHMKLESLITTNETLPNIHPGEVLQEEFLIPLNITAKISKKINKFLTTNKSTKKYILRHNPRVSFRCRFCACCVVSSFAQTRLQNDRDAV